MGINGGKSKINKKRSKFTPFYLNIRSKMLKNRSRIRWDLEKINKLSELHRLGKTYNEMARFFRTSYYSVSFALRKYIRKPLPSKRRYTPEVIANIKKMYDTGLYTYKEIGKHFGVTADSIKYVILKYINFVVCQDTRLPIPPTPKNRKYITILVHSEDAKLINEMPKDLVIEIIHEAVHNYNFTNK